MSARIFHRIVPGALACVAIGTTQFVFFAFGQGDGRPGLLLAQAAGSPWAPYLYQYGVGGFFFFLAIAVAGYKGVFQLSHPSDRRMILFLVLGFVFYASLHGGWILLVEAGR
ncbi:MAG: hypothetical protein RIF32_01155 [Leptospirales bacterium]